MRLLYVMKFGREVCGFRVDFRVILLGMKFCFLPFVNCFVLMLNKIIARL